MIHSSKDIRSGESNAREASSSPAASEERPEIPGGPYWLLVRHDPRGGGRNTVFTSRVEDEKVLPIFSSREEADLFLGSGAESGYRPRETWAGELLSLLSGSAYSAGPCAGVEKVMLDPPPYGSDDRDSEPFGMDRRCFMQHLMGRRDPWSQRAK